MVAAVGVACYAKSAPTEGRFNEYAEALEALAVTETALRSLKTSLRHDGTRLAHLELGKKLRLNCVMIICLFIAGQCYSLCVVDSIIENSNEFCFKVTNIAWALRFRFSR
ncbi:hypothetical protein M0804_000859 [Polistes exclamans]|nr:hypothetical protein M0804_000859 [Polistes exclamans]